MLRHFELSDSRFTREGLHTTTITSPHLCGRGDITFYVPPGANEPSGIPLVILLHGVFGSHWGWSLRGGAHRTAARLLRKRAIPPMVLAMPSDGLHGEGTAYTCHGPCDFESWIVHDVPAVARRVCPRVSKDSPRFIAGLSMGGFGAIRLACRHPRIFTAASGLSSATHLEQLARFLPASAARRRTRIPDPCLFDLIVRQQRRLPALRFDCGTGDFLLPQNRALHQRLSDARIPHLYQEFPGDHSWPYWERHLEDTLLFFARVLNRRHAG